MPTDGIPSPTGRRGPGGDGSGHGSMAEGRSSGFAASGRDRVPPYRQGRAELGSAGSFDRSAGRRYGGPGSAVGSATGFYDESGGDWADDGGAGQSYAEPEHGRRGRGGDMGQDADDADDAAGGRGGDSDASGEVAEADQPAFNPLAGMRQLLVHCQMQGLVPDDGALVAMAEEGTVLPPGRTWFRRVEQSCQGHDRDRGGLITSAAFAQALREAMPDLQSGMEFSLVAGMGMQGVRRIDYEDFVMAMGTLFDRHASAVTHAEG